MCISVLGEISCLACNLCCCLGKAVNANRKQQVRTSYIMFVVSIMAIMWVLQTYLNSILDHLDFVITCPGDQGAISTCLGVSAIYRLSLILAIMHLILLFMCSFRNQLSREVNEGIWIFKILGVIALFFGFLYIDNSFFETYANIAKVIGGFFLIFQIVMIIDLCYIWGEKWVEIYDEGNSCFGVIMIITSLVLYTLTGWLTYKNFTWFAKDGCSSQMWYIIITLVLVIALTALTVSPIPKQKSIITSGAVSLYITYLTFSALTNSTVEQCNSFMSSNSTLTFQIAVGMFLYVIALCYVSYQTSENTSNKVKLTSDVNIAAAVLDDDPEDDDDIPEKDEEEGEKGPFEDEENQKEQESKKLAQQNQRDIENLRNQHEIRENHLRSYQKTTWINFHALMLVGSVYISMVMTNWAAQDLSAKTFASFTPSNLSLWVKLISAWFTALIYMWTAVVTRILGDEDDEENQYEQQQEYQWG